MKKASFIMAVVLLASLAFVAIGSHPNIGFIQTAVAPSGNESVTADSYLDQFLPDTNYGSTATMFVRTLSASRNMRTIVESATPQLGVSMDSAWLWIHKAFISGGSWPRTYRACQVTESWVEGTVTWNNQPAISSDCADAIIQSTIGWYRWDVTAIVQDWANGEPNYGLRIADSVEDSGSSRVSEFNAREHGTASLRPFLQYDYSYYTEYISTSERDAYISAGPYSYCDPDTNYGSETELIIGQDAGGLCDTHSAVKWDMSAIPAGSTIITADILMYMWQAPSTTFNMRIARISEGWGEYSVTWNNQPTQDFANSTTYTVPTSTGYQTYNITDIVADIITDGNTDYGFMFLREPAVFSGFARFYSREWSTSSGWPQLTIEYIIPTFTTAFQIQLDRTPPTSLPIGSGVNFTVPVQIVNEGDTLLLNVTVELDDGASIVALETRFNIAIGATDTFNLNVLSGDNPGVGTFTWWLNGTANQTDPDTTDSWSFSLIVVDPTVLSAYQFYEYGTLFIFLAVLIMALAGAYWLKERGGLGS